jgi:maltose alpha-D-glucosyltransferase / alpha-amylase
VIYDGDEIGRGDNVFLGDRNGVRTPMHWSSDKNAGFSRANPQGLFLPIILDPEYHYEAVNVEAQAGNPHSLLWWTRRVLALRKRWRAFGLGTLEFLHPDNRKILAFIRRHEDECILAVANLSRFVQPVELDLAAFRGCSPVELFGRTEFPRIGDHPYFLTLSPHAMYWFALKPVATEPVSVKAAPPAELLSVVSDWEEILEENRLGALESALPAYLQGRRWFASKSREIKSVHIKESIPVPLPEGRAFLLFAQVEFVQGDAEQYMLPLAFAAGETAGQISREFAHLIVAPVETTSNHTRGLLYDAVADPAFCGALLDAIARRRSLRGTHGKLLASNTAEFRKLAGDTPLALKASPGRAEQSNTSILYEDKLILKLFRKLEPGVNPDLEMTRYLADGPFEHIPPLTGALEYQSDKGDRYSLGVLNGFIANSKDAWEYTLDALGRYYDRIESLPETERQAPAIHETMLELAGRELPVLVLERLGTYLETARLLGRRTAEMHLALAAETEEKLFAPEPFTPFYQRSLYQSMRNLAVQNFQLLRKRLNDLPEAVKPAAQELERKEAEVLKSYRAVTERPIAAQRIRCHGDFHLGQVLHTGKDVFLFDFEGEPARSLNQRRIKHSPIRDVAGMVRSFHYASAAALSQRVELGTMPAEPRAELDGWAGFWFVWASVAFLQAYLETARAGTFLPESQAELDVLLRSLLLDKAVYELGYELNNRPAWVRTPVHGILQLIGGAPQRPILEH